jgi:hypothetical protein
MLDDVLDPRGVDDLIAVNEDVAEPDHVAQHGWSDGAESPAAMARTRAR